MRLRETARVGRFVGFDIAPDQVVALAPDHPAVVEGRTLFPSTVKGTFESPRFLVSGANNSKIGKAVEKGRWAGMPIYTLALEERGTCPRSCEQWRGCYGNSMPFARRHQAADPDFIPALKAEVLTLVRGVCSPVDSRPGHEPPRGIVIRLHVLGDFFSVAYVRMWADLLRVLPEVNAYGYTARRTDDEDPDSRAIAEAIRDLTDGHWDRFAIRTSTSALAAARSRAVVVDEAVQDAGLVMCPASTGQTEACSTCGLCWAGGARDKAIGFLRHGMKRTRAPRDDVRATTRRTPAPATAEERVAALPAEERLRIAAAYGAVVPGAGR